MHMKIEINFLRLHVSFVEPKLPQTTDSTNCYYLFYIINRNLPDNLVNNTGVSVAVFRGMVRDWFLLVGPEADETPLQSPYVTS